MRRILVFLAAVAVCAGAQADPVQVLAQLSAMVSGQSRRVPNYTCVQRIDRIFYAASFGVVRPLYSGGPLRKVRSCDEDVRLSADRTDRFRMEVWADASGEMYSWPGESRFERSLGDMLGFGFSSTGSFAAVLHAIFAENAPGLHFMGENTIDGQPTYAYSFSVPAERSTHIFVMDDGSRVKMAYEGTIFADRETGAPVRISVAIPKPPAEAGLCRFSSELDYQRPRIGVGEFLFPSKALQTFFLTTGAKTEHVIAFSSCREFGAESRLVTGNENEDEEEHVRGVGAPAPVPAIPSGLPVSIRLSSSIDSETAGAGDLFIGRLDKAVVDRSSNVIAPAGALVRGRVTGVERTMGRSSVVMRLAVESIEIGGRNVPVRLAAERNPYSAWPSFARASRGPISMGDLPELPPESQTVLRSFTKRYVIRAGTRTEWVTMGQLRQTAP